MTAAIEVRGVHKTYGRGSRRVAALRGISLAVAQGEIYGLLGRNGAGKTTLVKILLDIVRASDGETQLCGLPSRDVSARWSVGYLPEDHRFVEYQTASSALRFYASLSGVDGGTLRTRVPELLEQVGLTHAADKKIRGYSKGMKQRLGLAQALVHDPQVLFLDEPTDGVDPVGRAEIRDVLERLKGEGKTIFLNSHLLSEVEQLCDRVGILEGGSLVREGSVDALTQAEHVYRLVTFPPVDPETLAALQPLCATVSAEADGAVELGLEQDADIDRVVDLLRARGVGLRGLESKRTSLEQVFLAAVEEGGAGA